MKALSNGWRWGLVALSFLVGGVAVAQESPAAPAEAATDAEEIVAEEAAAGEEALPFGASLSLTNTVGVGTFIPGEFSKRPLYDISLGLSGYYSFLDSQRISASLSVNKSVVSNADSGLTAPGQTLLSDLGVTYSYSNFVKEPVTGIGVSGSLSVALPTSLGSQYRTQIMSVTPSLTTGGTWDWFSFRYTFMFKKYFHEYTHAKVEDAGNAIPICINRDSPDPEACFIGGYANASFQFGNRLGVGFKIIEDLNLNVDMWIFNTFTYEVFEEEDELTSENAVAGRGQRDSTVGSISLSYRVNQYFSMALGTTTAQPPKTRDNKSFRFPFFSTTADNFTSFYLSLTGSI